MRIDSHQHFSARYTPGILSSILTRNRFDGSVAVDAADTRGLLALSSQHDFVRAVVGAFDLELLDEFQRHPKFRGVRARGIPDDVKELEHRALTLDLDVQPDDLPGVARLAERAPALRLILVHTPKESGDAPGDLRESNNPSREVGASPHSFTAPSGSGWPDLAQFPNVFVKLTRLGSNVPLIRPYVQHLLAVFGPTRLMFGSDWPSALPDRGWKESLAAFTQAIGAQTIETREQLLGGTAVRVYGLEEALVARS